MKIVLSYKTTNFFIHYTAEEFIRHHADDVIEVQERLIENGLSIDKNNVPLRMVLAFWNRYSHSEWIVHQIEEINGDAIAEDMPAGYTIGDGAIL